LEPEADVAADQHGCHGRLSRKSDAVINKAGRALLPPTSIS
jgi:hypothetical protein